VIQNNNVQKNGVALIEPVGGHGGMNYYDFGLSAGLAKAGVPLCLYTCDETEVDGEVPFEVQLRFKRIYGSDPKPVRLARFVRGLFESLVNARSKGFRIVHFHFFGSSISELISVVCARLFGFTVVATVHDIESLASETSRWITPITYRLINRVIVHNEYCRRELEAFRHVQSNKVVVVPHGNYLCSSSKDVDRDEARRQLGLGVNDRVILFFGQIKESKGLSTLIQAIPLVRQEIPNLQLVVAGKVWKDDFSKYELLIEQLGIADSVIQNIHYIPDESVKVYFRAADLIVLPYRRIYQSGVLLMAMSYSVPALVSDIPAMLELVRDGETGFIFRAGDHLNLATRATSVLDSRESAQHVAKRALEYVTREHDWEKIGAETAAVYSSS